MKMGLTSRDFNKDFKANGYILEYGGYKYYRGCSVRFWRLYLIDKRTNEGFWHIVYSIEEAYEVAKSWIEKQ